MKLAIETLLLLLLSAAMIIVVALLATQFSDIIAGCVIGYYMAHHKDAVMEIHRALCKRLGVTAKAEKEAA